MEGRGKGRVRVEVNVGISVEVAVWGWGQAGRGNGCGEYRKGLKRERRDPSYSPIPKLVFGTYLAATRLRMSSICLPTQRPT